MKRPARCKPGAHGPLVACDRMGLDTDGHGFPHPQELRGRIGARHCRGCNVLVCQRRQTRVLLAVVLWEMVGTTPVAPLCPKCFDRGQRKLL